MKSLLQLIHDYHSGVKNAGEEILKRMEPLIKSYASRIHCMERDDATQELYLTLLNTLPYLNGKNFSEGECVRYMQTAIKIVTELYADTICQNLKEKTLIRVLLLYRQIIHSMKLFMI